MAALDFEKPIIEIQRKIEELKRMSLESGMDLDRDIKTLEQEAAEFKKELFENLNPAQKIQIARHAERPKFLDYVNLMCTDFVELHGDRVGTDDRAIVGGLAKLDGKPIMII
ncbi:acetyl-CoA carboxylase carboxyl transferase subunit alpha, partial [bacterium]|nr:acetyl-CoA carboxylase carboxyl transferase subunit alpha [bacterium]